MYVHTGSTRFITTLLLASPVQLFLLKAVGFSLAFLFSSIWFIEFLNLSNIRFVRHGCRRCGANRQRLKSDLRCGHHLVPMCMISTAFFFFLAILKKVLISLRKYKFPKLMIFIFIWSKNYEISICISFVSPGNSHRKTNFLFPW